MSFHRIEQSKVQHYDAEGSCLRSVGRNGCCLCRKVMGQAQSFVMYTHNRVIGDSYVYRLGDNSPCRHSCSCAVYVGY